MRGIIPVDLRLNLPDAIGVIFVALSHSCLEKLEIEIVIEN